MQKTSSEDDASARPYPRWVAQTVLLGVMVGLLLLTSACGGGDPKIQQQASQNKAQLDSLLKHAQAIGVPTSLLQPILSQEQQLASTSVPFTLFNDQPATNYNKNLATRYQQLVLQTQSVIATTTEAAQSQAQREMQNFQLALTQRRTEGFHVDSFSLQFNQDQGLLATAQYPKDYVKISNDAYTATQALNLMKSTSDQLTTFKNTIAQMKQAHLDVTAMQLQYQNDLQIFDGARSPFDFQNLGTLINAQYELAVVNSMQALPYVGAAKLGEFKKQIELLKLYGMDASDYQNHFNADQAAMKKASTLHDYLAVSQQIDADMAAMHDDLVQGQAYYMVKQIDQQARTWGHAHPYHDKSDGKDYILTAGYTLDGIGFWFNRELGWTYTTEDYQSVIDEENNELFNLQMLEADYYDKTPYDQVHATDLQMLSHYQLQKGQVLMVSLVEQALRLYQDGQLVRAFHVTTGRVERPSLPGAWTVQDRKSPTVFKSTEPQGSPYWYPDTPIQYGILYHWGGFFVHDAWWRVDFGPGTQFPHYDSGGDESFAGNGSHGCVNMQKDEAGWVYAHTDWHTMIVIY